jgi:large subunit ribosomal protein L38e
MYVFSPAAKSIKIKKTAGFTKFKIRFPKYLYTLKVTDSSKADKITQSLPPKLSRTDI